MADAAEESAKLPEIVYHYTSIDSLLKILEGRRLRATNIRYLNDLSEHQLFLETVKSRLPYVLPEMSAADKAEFAKPETLGFGNTPEFVNLPFVTSFSAQDDSLNHWRSYCPASNGVSIGFRTSSLREGYVNKISAVGTLVPHPVFGYVYYLEPKNVKPVDEVIQSVSDQLRKQDSASSAPFWQRLAAQLISFACFVKHRSFINEQEYRLAVSGIKWRQDLLRFRPNRSTLVPYVEINVPTLDTVLPPVEAEAPYWNAIASITIGPTANMSLSYESLAALCSTRGIFATIKKSEVPYRDW